MNDNFHLDVSYMAGLFDGEGSVYVRQITEKRKNKNPCKVWKIRMEMSMTDKNVMELFHETLGVGILKERKFNNVPAHYKKQYRWMCSHRQALQVCKLFWPHSIVKLQNIEKIIDHYEPDIQSLDDNIVDLAKERELRND